MLMNSQLSNDCRQLVSDLWISGVDRACGFHSVRRSIELNNIELPTQIVAIGKAAGAMAAGARVQFGKNIPTLVITKYAHVAEDLNEMKGVQIIEAAHPIPDNNSLLSGEKVLHTIQNMGKESRLLMLVSGGASSLVEVLKPGSTLETLTALNRDMISKDLAIEEINKIRRTISRIKSGGLLSNFNGSNVDVIFISDVVDDNTEVIGSGIAAYPIGKNPPFSLNSYVAANNAWAREAIVEHALDLNIKVVENKECLNGEITILAKQLAYRIKSGDNGIYIWGGEPTVELPEKPGTGGRNQALALLLAREIQGMDGVSIVVGGTDGTDGPTDAAGGIVDGSTYQKHLGHDEAVKSANSGEALKLIDSLLVTGPTGTNVMDIIVAAKLPGASI